jgi:hypothetical protein
MRLRPLYPARDGKYIHHSEWHVQSEQSASLNFTFCYPGNHMNRFVVATILAASAALAQGRGALTRIASNGAAGHAE